MSVFALQHWVILFYNKQFGLQIDDGPPTAWDFVFSNMKVGHWVKIKLKNNDIILGKYSKKSYTSSNYDERDIFLEKIYELDSNNGTAWIEVPNNDGILIKWTDILTISFIHTNKGSKKTEEAK